MNVSQSASNEPLEINKAGAFAGFDLGQGADWSTSTIFIGKNNLPYHCMNGQSFYYSTDKKKGQHGLRFYNLHPGGRPSGFVSILKEEKDIMLLHLGAGSHWAGYGERAYQKPQIILAKKRVRVMDYLDGRDDGGLGVKEIEAVLDYEELSRSNWRTARVRLEKRMDELTAVGNVEIMKLREERSNAVMLGILERGVSRQPPEPILKTNYAPARVVSIIDLDRWESEAKQKGETHDSAR